MPVYDSVLDLIGNTPMVDVSALSPNPRAHRRQARRPEPRRIGQGPSREVDDRRGGEGRHPHARVGADRDRVVVWQHGHRAGDDLPHPRLQAEDRPARERVDRAAATARGVGRRDPPVTGRRRIERCDAPRAGDGQGTRRLVVPVPVRQPGQPEGALRGHRSRDLARLSRGHALRVRPRHGRHDHRRRHVPQGAQSPDSGVGHRAADGRDGRRPEELRRRIHPAGVRGRQRLRVARQEAGRRRASRSSGRGGSPRSACSPASRRVRSCTARCAARRRSTKASSR